MYDGAASAILGIVRSDPVGARFQCLIFRAAMLHLGPTALLPSPSEPNPTAHSARCRRHAGRSIPTASYSAHVQFARGCWRFRGWQVAQPVPREMIRATGRKPHSMDARLAGWTVVVRHAPCPIGVPAFTARLLELGVCAAPESAAGSRAWPNNRGVAAQQPSSVVRRGLLG